MGIYRITNITDKLGKRDVHYNKELEIDYVDGMERKKMLLKPTETTYLSVPSMPLSIHRMRIKSWIQVDQIGKKELKKEMDKEKKKNVDSKSVTTTTTTKKKRTYTKKTTTKPATTAKKDKVEKE